MSFRRNLGFFWGMFGAFSSVTFCYPGAEEPLVFQTFYSSSALQELLCSREP